MLVPIGFAAVFLILFGAFALTGGREGRVGGNGLSFRAMLIGSPRMLRIESAQRREHVATAVVYVQYALTAALVTGIAFAVWLAWSANR